MFFPQPGDFTTTKLPAKTPLEGAVSQPPPSTPRRLGVKRAMPAPWGCWGFQTWEATTKNLGWSSRPFNWLAFDLIAWIENDWFFHMFNVFPVPQGEEINRWCQGQALKRLLRIWAELSEGFEALLGNSWCDGSCCTLRRCPERDLQGPKSQSLYRGASAENLESPSTRWPKDQQNMKSK